jgi:dTDP-glucose 4,6-dehydratase
MVAQSWLTPEDWYETNVVALAKFTRELSRLQTLDRFINFSTPEVYGTTENWIEENFNFHPTTPYAISRAAGDLHLKSLLETFDFPVIFTRAANVYGPGQQLYRVVPRAILAGLLGRKIPLQGGGTSVRSFIHIDDVSRALIDIIGAGQLGESYHISTNELVTIYELMGVIAQQIGIDVLEMVEIAPERPGKDFAYKLSSEKLRGQLGWSDTITLKDGIAETIQWATLNLDALRETATEYRHQR